MEQIEKLVEIVANNLLGVWGLDPTAYREDVEFFRQDILEVCSLLENNCFEIASEAMYNLRIMSYDLQGLVSEKQLEKFDRYIELRYNK